MAKVDTVASKKVSRKHLIILLIIVFILTYLLYFKVYIPYIDYQFRMKSIETVSFYAEENNPNPELNNLSALSFKLPKILDRYDWYVEVNYFKETKLLIAKGENVIYPLNAKGAFSDYSRLKVEDGLVVGDIYTGSYGFQKAYILDSLKYDMEDAILAILQDKYKGESELSLKKKYIESTSN